LLKQVAKRGVLVVAALLTATVPARASIWLGNNAVRPVLRVDARGDALVSWMHAGKQQSLLVPPQGQLFHTGSLAGPDISSRTAVLGLSHPLAERMTPNGTFWALQQWHEPGGQVELHLARWRGAPTRVFLVFDGTRLTGRVTLHSRPVSGKTFTPEGKRPRIYVYLDFWTGAWHRMLGVAPRADGSFAVLLRPNWKGSMYRATVAGPNIGSTLAPDAQTVALG
jgi:hypothetical protein